MDLLITENITKQYANHTALKNVSISIPEQSIFGLLGPNGAGKTTLIRIITRIINQDEGSITFNGQPMTVKLTESIGYLPEERGLYKKMKVGEQLMYLAQLKGLKKQLAVERIKYWFDRLEISAWWNKNIEDLSKGMQQKVQFVATVLHDPKLIILDEPFSGFDPVNANLIKDEILELRRQGATIIFSTHRMESVEELCDNIALINKAEKILDGPKKQIKDSFKDNTFVCELMDMVELDPNKFKVKAQDKNESGGYNTTIQMLNGESPNELLQVLIPQTRVVSFLEKVPSINEIFIAQVKEEPHA